jgi:ubiquinone/menaquinone biosynthesis C-methylase UbiE
MTTQQMASIDQISGAWNGIARGFDEFVTPENPVLGKEVVRLGLRPGTRLLDVAAGSGALSIPAARIGAEVVAIDLAPATIERLNARARAEGLSTLCGRLMDGHALDLDDDAFAVAASVNGVSLFPDMARGLAELVRVTRPGGRVMVVAPGRIESVEFIVFVISALQAAVPGVTPTAPPSLPFQAANREVLRERLANAGLRDIGIDTITWVMAFDSAVHLRNLFTAANPMGAQVATGLSNAQRAEVIQVLDGDASGAIRGRAGGLAPRRVQHRNRNRVMNQAADNGGPIMTSTTKARYGALGVAIAPAVMLFVYLAHPFIVRLPDAAAVAHAVHADTTWWGFVHLLTALGSALVALAFLAIRAFLRDAGEERFSPWALPFAIVGSALYGLLPGLEFAPLAAALSGADARAAQAALQPWFIFTLATSGILFAIGIVGFACAVASGRILNRPLTRLVVTGLLVWAAARLVPLGLAQFYVQGVAGIVALWPLAFHMWQQPKPTHGTTASAGSASAFSG